MCQRRQVHETEASTFSGFPMLQQGPGPGFLGTEPSSPKAGVKKVMSPTQKGCLWVLGQSC